MVEGQATIQKLLFLVNDQLDAQFSFRPAHETVTDTE